MTFMWIFLCTYPMFYTAGMCDVTYIGVYNTYLHSKCFLSAPYNNITSGASPHSKLLIVYSDSSPRVYAVSQSSPLCTDQRHISCRNTVWSVYTVLLLSGPMIFEAVTRVIPHLNHKPKKFAYFFDGNIRWLCWGASCSSRWHVLMEVAVCFG